MKHFGSILARAGCFVGRHIWDGCTCRVCGKERHQWQWVTDPDAVYGPVSDFMDEMQYYHQQCARCGKVKRG